ncbi:response regulator [Desulfosudis oleivorans]|uniref:Response regulator receiver protein n=1 Tax=Desulfosudis oleivorans (strain DSM 6200 / JCM 39069 / Hxd3) TaxID=96561 RepID=A8ZVY1_DESOH|nr:response regulator [Desulfosudis oleivorans]ABW66690.1 response regulator receiver protein [Desulfosudis oleivorans Hxd3]
MEQTIMIVDDSTSVRKMVAFTLENAGYAVVEAENGRDALEKINGSPIHMFIVDLNMPYVDGLELTRSVRAMDRFRFTPIVMLTTESMEAKKQEGRAAGATGWITKPFKPDQLVGVVKKVMPAN